MKLTAQIINAKTLSVTRKLNAMEWWRKNYYEPAKAAVPALGESEHMMLWELFRQGGMLCELAEIIQKNIIRDYTKLTLTDGSPKKILGDKENVIKFINICNNHFFIYEANDFQIANLYNDDLHTYYDCLQIVDELIKKVQNITPNQPKEVDITPKFSEKKLEQNEIEMENIAQELILTERNYVAKIQKILDILPILQKSREKLGTFEGYDQTIISLNYFKSAINFQQIFLLDLEALYRHNKYNKNLGLPFIKTLEANRSFEIYNEFCSNYKYTLNCVMKILKDRNDLFALPIAEVENIFIAPIQRICKYPLLLENYIKKITPNNPIYKDIQKGIEITKEMATKVNEYSREATLRYAAQNFIKRVDNFFGNSPKDFGNLLAAEKITFFFNEQSFYDHILYIFENILFVCKPVSSYSYDSDLTQSSSLIEIVADIKINTIHIIDDYLPEGLNLNYSLRIVWLFRKEPSKNDTKVIYISFPSIETYNSSYAILKNLFEIRKSNLK